MSLDAVPRLIVEGKTDEYAITQLLMRHDIYAHEAHGKKLPEKDVNRVQVVVEFPGEDPGGRSKLLTDWSVRLRSPKSQAIGLVLDADTAAHHQRGPQVTWTTVRQTLMQPPVGLSPRPQLEPGGFIGRHSETNTLLGVWIMPDNQSEGSLEVFLRQLIEKHDTVIHFAEGSARCAKLEPYFAPYEEKDLSKAVLATWLAWQTNPGMTIGSAFKHQKFLHDATLAARFVDWVRRLIAQSQS